MKLFIDTDIGDDIDDALAIGYALAKGCDIVGIATVYREADKRVGIVGKLLKSANAQSVPLYCGYSHTLSPKAVPFGKLNYDVELSNDVDISDTDVADAIADCAEKYGKELVVLEIGGQTNLAVALQKHPESMAKAGKIVIMGGCFTLHQNEWNIAQDPTAARIVSESMLPITYVPWNVTKDISLGQNNFEKVLAYNGTGVAGCVSELTKIWHERAECKYVPVLHDPAALMCLLDESMFDFADTDFCVVDDGVASGLTLNLSTMNLFALQPFYKKSIKLVTSANKDAIVCEFMRVVYGE